MHSYIPLSEHNPHYRSEGKYLQIVGIPPQHAPTDIMRTHHRHCPFDVLDMIHHDSQQLGTSFCCQSLGICDEFTGSQPRMSSLSSQVLQTGTVRVWKRRGGTYRRTPGSRAHRHTRPYRTRLHTPEDLRTFLTSAPLSIQATRVLTQDRSTSSFIYT